MPSARAADVRRHPQPNPLRRQAVGRLQPVMDFEALKAKRLQSLRLSEKAVSIHAQDYCRIRAMVDRIVSEPVDIADYYVMATRLSRLLQNLTRVGPDTIFHYFTHLPTHSLTHS